MKIFRLLALTVCIFFCMLSCKKDFYANSPSDKLSFSQDTVRFDTIFTEKGSTTLVVKIKNDCDGVIKIDKIYLESPVPEFYINVNGVQGPCVENIDVASGDSVFVFVQTKLKGQKVDTLLYHEAKIVVEYNSLKENIVISAWGQDVVNFKGTAINSMVFTANKPYVIYDSLVVNQGETLTVEAGAKIYLHYNANIIVKGTLKIQGNFDNPVLVSSDRLEETYQLLPGQWGSIIFESTSSDNEISFAQIKNGVNGLIFYGDANHEIDCNLNNSQISNMSGHGIYAINGHVDSYNCVLANCEYNILNLQGGWFNGIHNTIYNEGTPSGRKYIPAVSIVDLDSDTMKIDVKQANFYNSIVVGTMSNEIAMTASKGDNSLPCIFQNCLLRDTYTKADSCYYRDNVFYDKEKTLFSQPGVFTLDSLSQAKDLGKLEYANTHPIDMLNHSRIADEKPDVGAMEYYEEKKDDKE